MFPGEFVVWADATATVLRTIPSSILKCISAESCVTIWCRSILFETTVSPELEIACRALAILTFTHTRTRLCQ